MKRIRLLGFLLTFLFICTNPTLTFAADNTTWDTVYGHFILDGTYLTMTDPAFFKEAPDTIRFGLYDLDADGFPELIAYNGCENMAGATNYVFTCKNGQLSYVGDVGFRGSVLRYYPTSNYHGLFCTDGNNGLIISICYDMQDGQIIQETVMEEDYNVSGPDGDPQITQITENDDLYTALLTQTPVTLDMFTVSEIRDIGWYNLLTRYPFVRSAFSDNDLASEPAEPSASPYSASPFYGIWCSASKSYEDMQREAASLTQQGLPAQIFVTTDWSNLNPEFWYVLTAGTYDSEGEAQTALAQIQAIRPDAYVKYSGEYIGG